MIERTLIAQRGLHTQGVKPEPKTTDHVAEEKHKTENSWADLVDTVLSFRLYRRGRGEKPDSQSFAGRVIGKGLTSVQLEKSRNCERGKVQGLLGLLGRIGGSTSAAGFLKWSAGVPINPTGRGHRNVFSSGGEAIQSGQRPLPRRAKLLECLASSSCRGGRASPRCREESPTLTKGSVPSMKSRDGSHVISFPGGGT